VGISEGKKQLGGQRSKLKFNIKVDFKGIDDIAWSGVIWLMTD
jgi:hypothetical protein